MPNLYIRIINKKSCFLTAFLYYACLFVVLVLVAAAGVFTGKKLRDRKDAKKSKEAESEITIEE